MFPQTTQNANTTTVSFGTSTSPKARKEIKSEVETAIKEILSDPRSLEAITSKVESSISPQTQKVPISEVKNILIEILEEDRKSKTPIRGNNQYYSGNYLSKSYRETPKRVLFYDEKEPDSDYYYKRNSDLYYYTTPAITRTVLTPRKRVKIFFFNFKRE